MISLAKGERVITAYAEPAGGPGWSNRPIYVIIKGLDGTIREECVQPKEQSSDMASLYDISAVVSKEMTQAVVRDINEKEKGMRNNQRGFTLAQLSQLQKDRAAIELALVISVISVATVVGIGTAVWAIFF